MKTLGSKAADHTRGDHCVIMAQPIPGPWLKMTLIIKNMCHAWICVHCFAYFWSISLQNYTYCKFSNKRGKMAWLTDKLAFLFRRRIDFQDSGHSGHLGFLIGTILALFNLQITLMHPTDFQVNWAFSAGEEAKNIFSRWQPWWPSWLFNQNDFSHFDLLVTLMLPIKF